MDDRRRTVRVTALLMDGSEQQVFEYFYSAALEYIEEIKIGDKRYYHSVLADEVNDVIGEPLPELTRDDCVSLFKGKSTSTIKEVLITNKLKKKDIRTLLYEEECYDVLVSGESKWEYINNYTVNERKQ